ncbi:MAG TPA: AMP-binding protein, partial [Actinoplanes sp.]|nr:AMP-binding protein [Actinoplanes sp.]
WFRMMDRYRITVTAGPDFAYELCARVIPDEALAGLDLSCLRYAFNGSEPIHPPTARAFTERFARIGLGPGVLSPAYGLAESTAYVSATGGLVAPTVLDADRSRLEDGVAPELASATDGESRPVISVGRVEAFDTVIVDPRTRRALPAGRVGEIWLRGPGIGAGYWNKPELSARIFAARLAEPVAAERGVAGAVSGEPRVADPVAAQRGVAGAEPEERGWLRTGDLGAMVGGELFVTGRLKELLIVNGRNLAPQDVEKEARAAHDALGGQIGAAFGVAAPDERIVLVHEVDPRTPRAELPAVAGAVTRRLSRSFGIPLRNVVLVRRGTVRRTTSGKIRRTAMRDRFLAGEITALHADLEPAVRAVPAGS